MEQQLDAFTQKRFELMVEMATKKLQQEIAALKEHLSLLNNEVGSLKSQITRLQFQPQHPVQKTLLDNHPSPQNQQVNPKKSVEIIDCRPHDERREEFKSGAEKNTEPVRPRYGNYEPEDVSIDKFFYFGRK
ncbi:hypothetical protein HYY70_00415 [Candidatus Woesearchaeota archaeon]|nr:hypothetical protein [Candidatus Woesearchaeota archaeon]